MRIAYLTHYFPPESNAPAARVHELSRALVAAGHTVHVVTGQPNHPRGVVYPGYRAAEYRRERVDGIDVRRVPTLAAASRGVLVRGLGYAALPPIQVLAGLALPPIDVVLATSPQILTGLAGLVLARLRRVPFVLEVRDLWPEGITAAGAMREGHPVIRALELVERALYHGAAGIVSVTDSFVAHFTDRGFPRDRIAVIKNGIDAALFDPDTPPADLRATLKIPADALLLVYCGNLGMPQGVGLLARAAAIAPEQLNLHVVIVGTGVDRDNIAAEIASLNIAHRVHLLPPVQRREVPAILAAADVISVLLRDRPTYDQYLPSKIFEAMAMRHPILLGLRGEARQLLEAAAGGVAHTPDDPRSVVAALTQLAALGAEGRRHMGQAARDYVLTHHDRARQALDLAAFLQHLSR